MTTGQSCFTLNSLHDQTLRLTDVQTLMLTHVDLSRQGVAERRGGRQRQGRGRDGAAQLVAAREAAAVRDPPLQLPHHGLPEVRVLAPDRQQPHRAALGDAAPRQDARPQDAAQEGRPGRGQLVHHLLQRDLEVLVLARVPPAVVLPGGHGLVAAQGLVRLLGGADGGPPAQRAAGDRAQRRRACGLLPRGTQLLRAVREGAVEALIIIIIIIIIITITIIISIPTSD